MREIKFRAWDSNRLWYPEDWAGSDERLTAKKDEDYDTPMGLLFNALDDLSRQNNIILMQYTGLKDKKGVEIYEGDIISCSQAAINTVEYGYGGFGISNYHVGFLPLHDQSDVKVIGNVWENSELLEQTS